MDTLKVIYMMANFFGIKQDNDGKFYFLPECGGHYINECEHLECDRLLHCQELMQLVTAMNNIPDKVEVLVQRQSKDEAKSDLITSKPTDKKDNKMNDCVFYHVRKIKGGFRHFCSLGHKLEKCPTCVLRQSLNDTSIY